MKKFFQDFKKFISKGNIVDLAIGVIIGNAFSAIVKALTDKIIMPLINWLLSFGGAEEGLASAFTFLKKVYNTDGTIDLSNSIYIDWGAFITAILNFFIIAMTLFIILKVAMKSSEWYKQAREKALEDIEKNQLTKQDKQELKKRGISRKDKEAVKAFLIEKHENELKQKQEAEQVKKAQEEEALKNSTEYLLKDIRDLLSKTVKVESNENTISETDK